MPRALVWLVVGFLLLPPSAGAAPPDWQTLVHPRTGVQFSFPPDWRISNRRDTLVILSPQDEVTILLRVQDNFEWTAHEAYLHLAEPEIGPNASLSLPEGTSDLNGLEAFVVTGTVVEGGRRFELIVAGFAQPGTPVSGYLRFTVEAGAAERFRATIAEILNSLSVPSQGPAPSPGPSAPRTPGASLDVSGSWITDVTGTGTVELRFDPAGGEVSGSWQSDAGGGSAATGTLTGTYTPGTGINVRGTWSGTIRFPGNPPSQIQGTWSGVLNPNGSGSGRIDGEGTFRGLRGAWEVGSDGGQG